MLLLIVRFHKVLIRTICIIGNILLFVKGRIENNFSKSMGNIGGYSDGVSLDFAGQKYFKSRIVFLLSLRYDNR